MQEVVGDIYSQEIKDFYTQKAKGMSVTGPLFLALHSDHLNLQVQEERVMAKSTFYDGDIILEVRGKVVQENLLLSHLAGQGKKQYDGCYGILGWLDLKTRMLIRPIGMSEALIRSSMISQREENKLKGNCYIEEHFGSKLLVKASEMIVKGDTLILENSSLKQFLYM